MTVLHVIVALEVEGLRQDPEHEVRHFHGFAVVALTLLGQLLLGVQSGDDLGYQSFSGSWKFSYLNLIQFLKLLQEMGD